MCCEDSSPQQLAFGSVGVSVYLSSISYHITPWTTCPSFARQTSCTPRRKCCATGPAGFIPFAWATRSRMAAIKYITSWAGEDFPQSGLQRIESKLCKLQRVPHSTDKISLKKWVSVKIMTADSTCHSRELQTLQALQQKDAAKYIVRLFDSFVHQGPNGNHQCLVFELLGPTVDTVVADYHFGGDCLEPENLLRLTKQLLEAVASIHSAGYAHGGDYQSLFYTGN